MMKKKRRTLKLPVTGEEVAVPRVTHSACSKCGEIVFTFQESKAFTGAARERYRKKHRLLSPQDVRALRERLRFTHAMLGRRVGVGGSAVAGWELGRNVQTVAIDAELRRMGEGRRRDAEEARTAAAYRRQPDAEPPYFDAQTWEKPGARGRAKSKRR
jgi:putative zinc finger/helix-turn-helix YgiT family protein